jgi:hypothetical protein
LTELQFPTKQPTPPQFEPEIIGFPHGSPCQPVRFGADALVLIPIIKDEKGKAIEFIYKHLQRLANSAKVVPGIYEVSINSTPLMANIICWLTVGKPVVIKNPFTPEAQFSMEFLHSTYRIPPVTLVDIHGELYHPKNSPAKSHLC